MIRIIQYYNIIDSECTGQKRKHDKDDDKHDKKGPSGGDDGDDDDNKKDKESSESPSKRSKTWQGGLNQEIREHLAKKLRDAIHPAEDGKVKTDDMDTSKYLNFSKKVFI